MEKAIKTLKWLLADLILLRLLSLPFNAISDVTEARYAEIGRKMAESGNFVTPFIRDGVPFWGKPPLSFWLSALSIDVFGANEFGARFSSFVFMMLTAGLIYYFALRVFDKLTALMAAVILFSCSVVLYLAGAIMTDPALIFTMVLCGAAFWFALYAEKHKTVWGYVFFAGLGLTLLAKGLVGVVLVAMAIFLWSLVKNKWKDVWNKIPWVSGTLLTFMVAAPWYLMAEVRTPGFLEYFIIGEHFERFLTPHWSGDLYGAGRGGFRGIIWLFYLVVIMPWGLYFIWLAVQKIKKRQLSVSRNFFDDKVFYVLVFILAPLVFFTFSGNTLLPYAALALPFSAVLFALIIKKADNPLYLLKFKVCVGINIFLLLAIIVLGAFGSSLVVKVLKTDKWIWQVYMAQTDNKQIPLFYLNDKRFSGDFYGQGYGDKISFDNVAEKLGQYGKIYLVVQEDDAKTVTGKKVYCNKDSCLLKLAK